MEFNTERCEKYASSSLSLVTALAPIIGHSRAAEVSKKAMETGQDILSVVTKSGILDENTAKTLLDPRHMLNVASSD
jgi:aspartate ammonia-lyase